MTDYSVYYKTPTTAFSMENPRPDPGTRICFKIKVFKRSLRITVYKDISLEDLYIKIYNAVYPEFSTERHCDAIPTPNTLETIPRLYGVSVFNKNLDIINVPVHRFITLSSFMKSKHDYFTNEALFGTPTFTIYAANEEFIKQLQSGSNQTENHSSYLQKILGCYPGNLSLR
jgi:hypothetical protein